MDDARAGRVGKKIIGVGRRFRKNRKGGDRGGNRYLKQI
jgi:hypothetical protein